MRNYGADKDGALGQTVYGDWADSADPGNFAYPSDAQARTGVSPLDTYPSKWFNAFQNFNSRNLNEAARCFLDLYKELLFVLNSVGIAPNKLSTTQVYEALLQIITNFNISNHRIGFEKDTVFAQITTNSTLSQLFGRMMAWYDMLVSVMNSADAVNIALQQEVVRAMQAEQNNASAIANEISRAQSVESGLANRAASLESRMGGAEGEITGLKNRATGVENRCSSLEGRMGSAESNISNLYNRCASLEGRMGTAEWWDNELRIRTDNMNGTLNWYNDRLNWLEARAQSIPRFFVYKIRLYWYTGPYAFDGSFTAITPEDFNFSGNWPLVKSFIGGSGPFPFTGTWLDTASNWGVSNYIFMDTDVSVKILVSRKSGSILLSEMKRIEDNRINVELKGKSLYG